MGGKKDLGAFSAVNNHKIHLEQPCKVATEIQWLKLASVCSEKNKEKEDSIPGGLVAETSLRKVSTVPSRHRHGDPADWQEGGSRCQAAPLSASSWRDPGKGECCRNALGNMRQARLSTWPRARVMMSLIASRRPEAWCVCVCVCVCVGGGWDGSGGDQRQSSREETAQDDRRHQYLRYTALEE